MHAGNNGKLQPTPPKSSFSVAHSTLAPAALLQTSSFPAAEPEAVFGMGSKKQDTATPSQNRSVEYRSGTGQPASLVAPTPRLFLPAPGSADGTQSLTAAFPTTFENVALYHSLPLPQLHPFWPGLHPHPSVEQSRTGYAGAYSADGNHGRRGRGGGSWVDDLNLEPGGRGRDVVRGRSPTSEMLVEHADALLSLGQSLAASEQVRIASRGPQLAAVCIKLHCAWFCQEVHPTATGRGNSTRQGYVSTSLRCAHISAMTCLPLLLVSVRSRGH